MLLQTIWPWLEIPVLLLFSAGIPATVYSLLRWKLPCISDPVSRGGIIIIAYIISLITSSACIMPWAVVGSMHVSEPSAPVHTAGDEPPYSEPEELYGGIALGLMCVIFFNAVFFAIALFTLPRKGLRKADNVPLPQT
ncbi:hypothetical protein DB346_11210 [Verrucomicrobia bacterium LW23]|nr:hypothetical protein DB346_11210 [Verrucomicrobia bacterium LW23]